MAGLAEEQYCYLTTRGRSTGREHTIEIWFALVGHTVYMLSGGGHRSDWVRNLIADPNVEVRIGDRTFGGRARLVEEAQEDEMARTRVFGKYSRSYSGDLTRWRQEALPVAVDLPASGE